MRGRVSILVLVDRAIQHAYTERWLLKGFLVSILVLVDRAIQRVKCVRGRHRELVSILVLVDRAIQLPLRRCKTPPLLGFRSLFLWIGRFNTANAAVTAQQTLMFRSLFLWIGRFNKSAISALTSGLAVSILVLVDRAIQPRAAVAAPWAV